MSDEVYYSKSKGKYIKIAEMPDQHVRYAFIKMNRDNHLSLKDGDELLVKLEAVRDNLNDLIDDIQREQYEKEKDKD